MSLKTVFEPLRIGPVTVKNRVVRTAHDTGMSRPDITDAWIGYHEARARGGCGLTILEAAAVHPSTALSMRLWGDRIVPGYQRLMAAVEPHGMKVFQQLWHGGNLYYGPDGVPLAVSEAPGFTGIVGLPMTEDDIAGIIAAYAEAARAARDGGLHGVEIHCAHGYIMHQFLSAVTNTRTDRWGGDFTGRSRFLMETVRAVRAAVGGEIAVGVRLSASESPGGVSQADNVRVLGLLQDENLIDFVDVSSGDYFSFDQMVGPMHQPTGYELANSAEILAAARVPRIVAGRYRTLEEADQAIRDGITEMVSMVRAQIADPDLVAKTQAGKAEQVRPCLGCNQGCGGGLASTGVLGCTINPAVGKEAQLSEHLIARAEAPRRVVVIGGGPAGMEAARIAALQGHAVVLLEASAQLGGQVNVARRAPKQQSLGDVTWWQEQELYRLGVDIRLGTYAEADDVRALAPDVVYV
ncbi:MAG: FAD-dependent oxidoreductase, partial [Sphingomonadales bacterium]|nr:FAD-dependent oxidoreductase [Sphingomonadales bacterium]